MNRAPNSSGRVDADATLTGGSAGAGAGGAAKAAAARRTQTGSAGESRRSGRDSSRLAAERAAQAREAAEARAAAVAQAASGSGSGGSSSSSATKSPPTFWNRLGRFNPADVASAVGGYYKEKAIKGIKALPGNTRRFARRDAVGGLVGGALGITGAAVGAASGDFGSATKLATAGAAAGYYGANYYGDKEAKNVDAVNAVINEAFWNEENKARQQYLSDEEFKNSEENIRMLAQFQGSMESARESMENGDVQAFRNEGFSDIKKIGRGLKLMQEYMKDADGDSRHRGMTKEEARQRAIAVTKWEDSAGGGLYETNSLAQQKFINTTKQQIIKNGMRDQAKAEAEVKDIIKDMAYVRFGV